MSKSKFSQSEWQQVKDAPYYVHAALADAEGRSALLTKRRESKALDEAISNYSTNNALVRDIIADDSDPSKEVSKANQASAERALSKVADLVEEKLGAEDLDAMNDFLLHVGQSIAGAAGEGILGMGKKVSDKEAAALESLTEALRATSAHKTERRVAKQEQQKQEWQARQDTEAKAKEASKAKAEAEARKKAEEEKAREATKAREDKMKTQSDRVLEEARERQRKAREEAEAEAQREAEEAAKWIAEHEVVAGDNLSMISQKYYGSQVHWGKIYEANKEVIGENPSLIRPGQRLRIPKI